MAVLDSKWLQHAADVIAKAETRGKLSIDEIEAVTRGTVAYGNVPLTFEIWGERRKSLNALTEINNVLSRLSQKAALVEALQTIDAVVLPPPPLPPQPVAPIPAQVWIVHACDRKRGKPLTDDLDLYVASSKDKAVAYAQKWLEKQPQNWICIVRDDKVDMDTYVGTPVYIHHKGAQSSAPPDLDN